MTVKNKQPALMLYSGDWFKDYNLRKCELATRGIWVDLLLYMHANDKSGVVIGSISQLSKMCGCQHSEMITALQDLKDTDTADVTFLGHVTDVHTNVTVINRRMHNDAKTRADSRLRKRKERSHTPSHKNVTLPSSIAVSNSISIATNITDELAQILSYFPENFFSNMSIPNLLLGVKEKHGDDALRAMCEKVNNIKDPAKRNGWYVRTIIKNTDLAGIKTGRVSETGEKLEWFTRFQCVAMAEGNTNGRTTDDLFRALKDGDGNNVKFPEDHRNKGESVWVKK